MICYLYWWKQYHRPYFFFYLTMSIGKHFWIELSAKQYHYTYVNLEFRLIQYIEKWVQNNAQNDYKQKRTALICLNGEPWATTRTTTNYTKENNFIRNGLKLIQSAGWFGMLECFFLLFIWSNERVPPLMKRL